MNGNKWKTSDYITFEDRLEFARAAYAAGDMEAHVAACWSCGYRPMEDGLVPQEVEDRFFKMRDLTDCVEDMILNGRLAAC